MTNYMKNYSQDEAGCLMECHIDCYNEMNYDYESLSEFMLCMERWLHIKSMCARDKLKDLAKEKSM